MQALKNELGNMFYTLEHIEEKGLLYSNWIGDGLSIDEVKKGALLCLDKIKETKVSLLLNDNRQLQGAWDGANDWIANEWTPKAVEAGLMKFAHIVSPDIFAQLSAEFMEENNQEMEGTFQFRIFENREEAENWLFGVHVSKKDLA